MFKIFINFKTYSQGTGSSAVELAKTIRDVQEGEVGREGREGGIEIIPVVQVVDLFKVKQAVKIPVWIQHLDFQDQGKFTGWDNLEAVIEAGAGGTLLNHSEHRIPPGTVKQIIVRVQSSKLKVKSFKTMVCCKTLGQMKRLVKFRPDFIAYEISQLIGGKVSITDFNQKAITHAVETCGEIPLLVGAGINKAEDLAVAKKLGAKGVLISSAVVLAKDQKSKLLELVSLLEKEKI